MSKKRRREQTNVDTRLVEIYEDLANEDEDVQLKAAQALLSHLAPSNNPPEGEVEKAVRRLFRGLCSGRKAARLGFSITLTELLAQIYGKTKPGGDEPKISLEKIFGILESQTNPTGNVSGQEERDHYFGRLFGAEALLKSAIIFGSSSPAEKWTRLLDLVFDLAVKKPWLREECGWVAYSSILDLPTKVHGNSYAEAALQHLNTHQLTRTPEGVAIWILAKRLFPTMKLPRNIWHQEDPLNPKDKAILAKVLKEASLTEQEGTKAKTQSQKGNWSPRLHFAWTIVLEDLYRAQEEPGWSHNKDWPKRMNFVDFWEAAVDNNLFAAAASDERKHWGFQLFIQVVKDAPQYLAIVAFSKNMVRCLINHLTQQERFLHRMAERAIKSIHVKATSYPDFAAAAFKGLLGPSGAINFDQATKTKTIEKLLAECGYGSFGSIMDYFRSLMKEPSEGEKAAAAKRQILADYLVASLRLRSSQEKDPDLTGLLFCTNKILELLVEFGFFANPHSRPPISTGSQEMFRSHITSCLNNLMGSHTELTYLPYQVITIIRRKESERSGHLVIELDESAGKSLEGAWKTLGKIAKKTPDTTERTWHNGDLKKARKAAKKNLPPDVYSSQQSLLNAFKLLYSLTILQVYGGDPDALAILDELKVCYSKLGKHSTAGAEDFNTSETLIEILLSFASKPSKLFAKVSEQVFSTFSTKMNASSLQLLLNVLDKKENLAGQKELFDAEGDDEEEDEDEVMSDTEVDIEEGSLEEDGVDTSDSVDSSSSDGEEEDQDELTAFESKLVAALRTRRGEDDLNDSDREISSDDDMDDEEMEQLDGQLAEIFKGRQQSGSKKKEKQEAKAMMVNFKNRVLGLLEIYVKRQHSNELVLSLILPLLRLIRVTNTKHLADKACQLIRELNKLNKGTELMDPGDADPVWKLLKDVHAEAGRGGSNAFGSACSQSSLLLAKILVGHSKESVSSIVDVYGETRKRQLQDKTCQVQASFFSDWNNWCVSASQQLRA